MEAMHRATSNSDIPLPPFLCFRRCRYFALPSTSNTHQHLPWRCDPRGYKGYAEKICWILCCFFRLRTLRTLPPSPSCLIRKFRQYPTPFPVISTFSATCPPTRNSGVGDAFAFATDFLNHDVMLAFLQCARLLRWEFELALPPKLSLISI